MERDLEAFHWVANNYFYFHFKGKSSFTHNVSCDWFSRWLYYNNNDVIHINEEISIIKTLVEEHKLGEKGWKTIPDVQKFKASQYEVFDNKTIVFSPRLK